MPNKHKNGFTPSSFTYNSQSIASNKGVQCFRDHPRQHKAFSFGVSRDKMKKLYIDAILDNSAQKKAIPGPGDHELHKQWMSPS